jgi:hypothetical protein
VVFYRIQAANPVIVETLIVIRELRYCVLFLFFTPSPWNKNGDLVTGLPRGLYALSPSPLEKGGAICMGGRGVRNFGRRDLELMMMRCTGFLGGFLVPLLFFFSCVCSEE